jgi:hypothetical protein
MSVSAVLVSSGAAAGGLAGFVLGLPWEIAGADAVPYPVAAALVVTALMLDGTAWRGHVGGHRRYGARCPRCGAACSGRGPPRCSTAPGSASAR